MKPDVSDRALVWVLQDPINAGEGFLFFWHAYRNEKNAVCGVQFRADRPAERRKTAGAPACVKCASRLAGKKVNRRRGPRVDTKTVYTPRHTFEDWNRR